jgi:hypothetical protein
LIANANSTHVVPDRLHPRDAFVTTRKRPLKRLWAEHIGHKGIEKVQGNPGVHESGKSTKQGNTIAVATGRNEGTDNGLEWARKSRFGTLLPFNAAFFDERQLAHQTLGEAYAVRRSSIAIVLQYLRCCCPIRDQLPDGQPSLTGLLSSPKTWFTKCP